MESSIERKVRKPVMSLAVLGLAGVFGAGGGEMSPEEALGLSFLFGGAGVTEKSPQRAAVYGLGSDTTRSYAQIEGAKEAAKAGKSDVIIINGQTYAPVQQAESKGSEGPFYIPPKKIVYSSPWTYVPPTGGSYYDHKYMTPEHRKEIQDYFFHDGPRPEWFK